MKNLFLFAIIVFLSAGFILSEAQDFNELDAGVTGVTDGDCVWGDYDADGDMDLLITGRHDNGFVLSEVWTNNGDDDFSRRDLQLITLENSRVEWFDYDNDNDLDILICGRYGNQFYSKIYKNDENTFVDIEAGLIGLSEGDCIWGDYDNDGDFDIMLFGLGEQGVRSAVYRNDRDGFTYIETPISGFISGEASQVDYDLDGDLDVFVTGDADGSPLSMLYENRGDFRFVERDEFTDVRSSSCDWADYDNDGDFDLFLTGEKSNGVLFGAFYNNASGFFDEREQTGMSYRDGCARWGDMDGDGDLDLLISGDNGLRPMNFAYMNFGEYFSQTDLQLVDVISCEIAFADYDYNGTMDCAIVGLAGEEKVTKIYRNDEGDNEKPFAPFEVNHNVFCDKVSFSWEDWVYDPEGYTETFAIRIGKEVGSSEVSSIMIEDLTKERLIASSGQIYTNHHQFVDLLPGEYVWNLQIIDNHGRGSNLTPDRSLLIDFLSVDSVGTATACGNSRRTVLASTCKTYTPGNMFILQISDENGSFSRSVNLDTIAAYEEGEFRFEFDVPAELSGDGHLLRVLATAPKIEGLPYDQPLTILEAPDYEIDEPTDFVCKGQTYKYDITGGEKLSFNFTALRGSIVSEGDSFVEVEWTSIGEGRLEVFTQNTNGCTDTKIFPVEVIDSPPAPKINSGSYEVCPGAEVEYQAKQVSKVDYYWAAEEGEIIEGENKSKCIVRWNEEGSQDLILTYFDQASDCQSSTVFKVNVGGLGGEISGDSQPCSGETVEYQIDGVDNYELEIAVTGGEASELTQGVLPVTWGDPGQGEVKIRLHDPVTDCRDSLVVETEILETPERPTIDDSEPTTLHSSWDGENKWYYQEELIEGESGSELETIGEGAYYVVAVGENGCESEASESVDVIFGSVISPESFRGVKIYPSPAVDRLFVELDDNLIREIKILNSLGQVVGVQKSNSSKTAEIDVSGFTSGLYFVEITTSSGLKIGKFIVN